MIVAIPGKPQIYNVLNSNTQLYLSALENGVVGTANKGLTEEFEFIVDGDHYCMRTA
jgi:hypothetical protein